MIPSISFTPEFLAMIAGVVLLSVVFRMCQKLNTWYAALATENQTIDHVRIDVGQYGCDLRARLWWRNYSNQ